MTCAVCQAIADNPDETNVAIALSLATSEASVRRHKRASHLEIGDVDEFFDVPTSIITSRGKSTRLADGSWEKITYRPQDAAALEALTYDDVASRIALHTIPATDLKAGRLGRTLVVCAADLQIGKVQSGGGTQDTVNRAMSVYTQVKEYALAGGFAEIVFVDLGDVMEGFGSVVSQQQTNDLSLTDQFRVARRVLLEGVLAFDGIAPKLTYVAVSSNHCQVRNGIGDKTRANVPFDDWGLLIQETITDALPHIEKVNTGRHEEAVTYTTNDGTVLGFTHGHLSGSQDKVKDWFKGQSHGRRSNMHNADVLAFGHFHSPYISVSGDGRYVLGAPSLDPGSDWYANKTGETNAPGLMTFEVEGGKLKGWDIWHPEM